MATSSTRCLVAALALLAPGCGRAFKGDGGDLKRRPAATPPVAATETPTTKDVTDGATLRVSYQTRSVVSLGLAADLLDPAAGDLLTLQSRTTGVTLLSSQAPASVGVSDVGLTLAGDPVYTLRLFPSAPKLHGAFAYGDNLLLVTATAPSGDSRETKATFRLWDFDVAGASTTAFPGSTAQSQSGFQGAFVSYGGAAAPLVPAEGGGRLTTGVLSTVND